MSRVMLGLTIANIVGVPIATALGNMLGWRSAYALVAALGILTVIIMVAVGVPRVKLNGVPSARGEMKALARPQIILTLVAGSVGFGGMFSTFSYIAPTMTELTGFSEATVPLILVVYGVGMTCGALVSGRVAMHGLMRGIFGCLIAIAVMLALFGYAAHYKPTAVLFVWLLGFLPTVMVPMIQIRLMDVAHEGQSLAAALNHATLNFANALGAWLGGVVLDAGLGYEWCSRVGAILAVLGAVVAAASAFTSRREAASQRPAAA